MPRISEFYGIMVYMYFSDHQPPHFHAIYGQHEIEMEIRTGHVLRGFLPRRALGLVSEWRERYVDELLKNWELARDHRPLRQVPPLD